VAPRGGTWLVGGLGGRALRRAQGKGEALVGELRGVDEGERVEPVAVGAGDDGAVGEPLESGEQGFGGAGVEELSKPALSLEVRSSLVPAAATGIAQPVTSDAHYPEGIGAGLLIPEHSGDRREDRPARQRLSGRSVGGRPHRST